MILCAVVAGIAGVFVILRSWRTTISAPRQDLGSVSGHWVAEYRAGLPNFKRLRKEAETHPVEEVGRKLRSFMPWLGSDRLVDRSRN